MKIMFVIFFSKFNCFTVKNQNEEERKKVDLYLNWKTNSYNQNIPFSFSITCNWQDYYAGIMCRSLRTKIHLNSLHVYKSIDPSNDFCGSLVKWINKWKVQVLLTLYTTRFYFFSFWLSLEFVN